MTKMTEAALMARVRALLVTHWDPIGVGEVSAAQDEYDGYVPAIARKIVDGASNGELSAALLMIERERMGLDGNAPRASLVAARLSALRRR